MDWIPIGEGAFSIRAGIGVGEGLVPWWEVYHLWGKGQQTWVRDEVGEGSERRWSGGQNLMAPFPASPHTGDMGSKSGKLVCADGSEMLAGELGRWAEQVLTELPLPAYQWKAEGFQGP